MREDHQSSGWGQVCIQVEVRDGGAVGARVVAVAALEDLGVRAVGQGERFGLQRVVVELVEVAFESELVLRPDALQALDELAAAAVAFGVVEPPLADCGELRSFVWLVS